MPGATHDQHGAPSFEVRGWWRRVRSRWDSPALRTTRTVVGALVLLVLVGVVGGQLLGHALAAGIESLLQHVTLDQAG